MQIKETVDIITNKNRVAKIKKTTDNEYYVQLFVNKTDLVNTGDYKTLNGAKKFAKKFTDQV